MPTTAPVRSVASKTEDGKWNVVGHRDRIVRVTDAALAVFAQLYDEQGTLPRRACLPALHAGALQGVLDKLASYPRRLADLGDDYCSTGCLMKLAPERRYYSPSYL